MNGPHKYLGISPSIKKFIDGDIGIAKNLVKKYEYVSEGSNLPQIDKNELKVNNYFSPFAIMGDVNSDLGKALDVLV